MPSPARIHHPGRSRRRGVTVSGPARPIVRPPFRAAARLDLPGNAPSPRRSPPAALVPSPFRRAPRREGMAVPRRNPPPAPVSSSRRHGPRAGAANRRPPSPSGSPTDQPGNAPSPRRSPPAALVPSPFRRAPRRDEAAVPRTNPPPGPVSSSRRHGPRAGAADRPPAVPERQPDRPARERPEPPTSPTSRPGAVAVPPCAATQGMPSPAESATQRRSRRRGVTAPGPARPNRPLGRSERQPELDRPGNAPNPRRSPPAALCRRRSAVRSAMEFGGRAIPWPWRCCHERARTPGSECLRLPAAAAHGERQRDGSREGWVARGSSRSATSGWPSNGERHQGGSREPWVARGSSRSATSGWPSNGERHQGGSREPWVARGSSRSATSWLTLERRTAPGRLARILGHSRLLAVGGIGPTLERRTTLPATSCSSATSAPSRRPWPSRPSRSAPAPSAPPARRDGRDT
jgi:hypothetical protein